MSRMKLKCVNLAVLRCATGIRSGTTTGSRKETVCRFTSWWNSIRVYITAESSTRGGTKHSTSPGASTSRPSVRHRLSANSHTEITGSNCAGNRCSHLLSVPLSLPKEPSIMNPTHDQIFTVKTGMWTNKCCSVVFVFARFSCLCCSIQLYSSEVSRTC